VPARIIVGHLIVTVEWCCDHSIIVLLAADVISKRVVCISRCRTASTAIRGNTPALAAIGRLSATDHKDTALVKIYQSRLL
jgi:hypothetical protein